MESSEPPEIQIDLTPEFQQSLKKLAKRYPSIRKDLQVAIGELQNGNFVGDQIPGVGNFTVQKVRVRNRDIQKGKSAGYRLIYQIESPAQLLLLLLYSKSDRADISHSEIRSILAEFYH